MNDRVMRIANAQLAGARLHRTAVHVPPFLALIHPAGHATGAAELSFITHAHPGIPAPRNTAEVADALPELRRAFAGQGLRFELIEEVSGGLVPPLLATGLEYRSRRVLMAATPSAVAVQRPTDAVRIELVQSHGQAREARAVSAAAFGHAVTNDPPVAYPADGGTVLARRDGDVVAVASWGPVTAGVCELFAVATAGLWRGYGYGTLIATQAVQAAASAAGATLVWLAAETPRAERLYRGLGMDPVGTSVELVEAASPGRALPSQRLGQVNPSETFG